MNTSKKQAEQDMKWAIGINIFSLHFYGLGIETEGMGWRAVLIKLQLPLLFVAVFTLLIVPQTMALIKVIGYVFLISDNLKLTLLFYTVGLELVTLWKKSDAIATMMRYIKTDWMCSKSEMERGVMLKYAQQSRIVTIGGYILVGVTVLADHVPVAFGVVLRTVNNITDVGDRPLVMQSIYFFDAYRTPVYEMMALSQFVIGGIGGFFYTTVSTLFGMIVLHVSGQLENLYNRIENLVEDGNNDDFQSNFRLTIKEHERLISFSEMIEDTFSAMILEIAAGFSVIICFQGYLIIIMLGEDNDKTAMQIMFGIIYVTWALLISFVYSLVGDTLVTQSERIQYATYNCEWYKLSPKQAAQFIPLLVRSQKPLVITAGKIATITLPTFASLMKTIAGYISCLLAVRD